LFKRPGGWIIEKAIDLLPDNFQGEDILKETARDIAKVEGSSLQSWNVSALRWMILSKGYQDLGGHPPEYQKV
jgi:hypothetical protein